MEDLKATKSQLEADLNSGLPVLLIDIREEYEVILNPLPYDSVLHIPMAEFESALDQMNNNRVYLVCRSGERAGNLAYYISKTHHIPDIHFVEGGAQAILGIEI